VHVIAAQSLVRKAQEIPVIAYFAYGSNLCMRRLRSRVADARFVEQASLPGYVLKWHKRSNKDGSGKCSIEQHGNGSGIVHGAIFSLPEDQKTDLDRVEGLGFGYDEVSIEVGTATGIRECVTYRATATHIDDSLRPFSWYRDLVVAGAEALELHPEYVESLRLTPAIDDPDSRRDVKERSFIPCDGWVVQPPI
jgi:gamma-glutamylcyclotransferase (GGCT)/AIG2-like uncharacterized protein YtfP